MRCFRRQWARNGALFMVLALVAVAAARAATGDPPPAAEGRLPAPQWVGGSGIRGKVLLTWIRNPQFASVRIQRRPRGSGAPFERIAEVAGNSYADATVTPGESYTYRLLGVGPDGREGRPSSEFVIAVPASVVLPATPPRWEGWLPRPDAIGLKWSLREGEDVISTNVYRRVPPETEYRLVGSSTGTSFLDATVQPGVTYAYALTALDSSFRETPLSEDLVVAFAPEAPAVEPAREAPWATRRTRLVATVATGAGGQALFRPADVAVGPRTGNIYLADGGNGRIVVYSAAGIFLRAIGGEVGAGLVRFRRLLGLAVDRDETLLAVDAGAAAVYVFDPGGRHVRTIDVGRLFPKVSTGIIDAAVGPEGSLFVVDNFNHRVCVVGAAGLVSTFGGLGEGSGELSAPTFAATDAEGRLYLADALNSRVQVFGPGGEFIRSFGRSGLGPAGFGRPKGVAVSDTGEVFVADSWLNVVEVFDPEGRFVAALTDEADKPLDLGSPNGIALDRRGRIYIAERLSNRLQIREFVDVR